MGEFWELLIKGIPIGMSNTLPGISGGTMALVLKIYDRLITGIKKIRFKILIPIFLGAVIGVLGSSKLITILLVEQSNLMMAFLSGLILFSVKVTIVEVEKFDIKAILLFIVGLTIAYFYSVEINSSGVTSDISLFKFFLGGVIGSVAMILPGISGGTILIMLGLYQRVIQGISSFNLPLIIIFGLGVGSGLLSFSWLLSYLLNNYRSLLMSFLTGLILGSMRSVLPSQFGLVEIIAFIMGSLIIWGLSRLNQR